MPFKYQQPGSTFLIAVFLSVIILSLGLGAAQMIIKELNFSSDLLFGEQSYYAAESGVETILVNLEKNPVQELTDESVLELGQSQVLINTNNALPAGTSFELTLRPLASSRFRLLSDSDPTWEYEPEAAFDFDLQVEPLDSGVITPAFNWQWKVLCQDGSKSTYALQDNTAISQAQNFLQSDHAEGFVAGTGQRQTFGSWVRTLVPESCFFSLQNLTAETLQFTITAQGDGIAPAVAKIESIGQAGNRQKQISFDYAQQNLGGLFDFVFFHTEE